MAISKKMEKALNVQLKEEFYSGYLYLSMATYFAEKNLPGFAHWLQKQAQEEAAHAMDFYQFIEGRGGRVILEGIQKPPSTWKSPLDAMKAAYKHECMISAKIHKLVHLATGAKDLASIPFLNKYVEEQIEEEASADHIVQMLKSVGNSQNGLFVIDREMAQRQ